MPKTYLVDPLTRIALCSKIGIQNPVSTNLLNHGYLRSKEYVIAALTRARLAVAVTTLGMLSLTGCGNGGGAGAEAQEPTHIEIRSAITPSGSLTGPFLYAVDHGFYEKEGLTVEVSDGKGSLSTAKDVAQGNVQFGQVGSTTLAQSVDQGLPLISVAQEYGRGSYGVIVPEDSPIESLQDLSGHSVVSSAGSPETLFIPAVLEKLGMAPDSVKILNVDAAVKGTTYAAGQGDALGTTLPFFMPIVSPTRPSRELPFDAVGVTFPEYSIVTQPEFLKEHPEVVRKFLKASFAGFAAAEKDPEGVGESLKRHRPSVTDIDAQVEQFLRYQEFTCSSSQKGKPVGWHSPQAWEDGLKVFKEYGGVKGDISDIDRFFTNEFFEGADAIAARNC